MISDNVPVRDCPSIDLAYLISRNSEISGIDLSAGEIVGVENIDIYGRNADADITAQYTIILVKN